MKILILLASLIGFGYASAQDSLQSHIENGKFYGIFPVVGDYVIYSDSIALTGSVSKDSLYYKAISFFDHNRVFYDTTDHLTTRSIPNLQRGKTAASMIGGGSAPNLLLKQIKSCCCAWLDVYR